MLGVAHDRTGCVWHVRYALHDRVHLDGHQMADEANADDTLTDLVTVEASWNAVQGVSACNIQKGLKDKMSFCYVRALAIMLEPTRWQARCLFFFFRRASPMMRAAKQQAGGYFLYATPSTCSFRQASEFLSITAGWRQGRHLAWL